MVKDIRITYRKRHSYNTKTNKVRPVKTPGGKLVARYIAKKGTAPKCAETGKPLAGIPALRPYQYSSIPKHKRSVSRPYGGMLCAGAVRERILRAFILEESKIVKKMLVEKAKKAKGKGKK